MKKKVFWTVIVVLVVVLLGTGYFKLLPYWASALSVVTHAAGIVVGWLAKVYYDRYIKDDIEK